MLDLVLWFLGAIGLLLVAFLAVVAIVALASAMFTGAVLERMADLLIPGRKTGLGAEGVEGERAVVVRAFVARQGQRDWEGTIKCSGELWTARCRERALEEGCPVRIVSLEDLIAIVVAEDPE